MPDTKNTTRAFFSGGLPAQREAIQAAETMAATFAENPKLRGMIIVVTDDDGNTICKVTVPSQHYCRLPRWRPSYAPFPTREFSDVLGKPSQLTGDVFKRIFQPVAGLRGQPSLSARIAVALAALDGGIS